MTKVFYATRAEIIAARGLVKLAERKGEPVNWIHQLIADAGKYSADDPDREVVVLPKPWPADR